MSNTPDDRDPRNEWDADRDDHSSGKRSAFQDHDLIPDATAEIKSMAKEGLDHPSTKPVLTGAAIGAIAGGVLPVVTWPLGLVAGAGFMLYKRLRP